MQASKSLMATLYIITLVFSVQEVRPAHGLVYIVQQTCSLGTIRTPLPSQVFNQCLECICYMPTLSICKTIIAQLKPACLSTTVTATQSLLSLINPRDIIPSVVIPRPTVLSPATQPIIPLAAPAVAGPIPSPAIVPQGPIPVAG